MHTKEKEAMMNYIYKCSCKMSNAAFIGHDLMDVKSSMVDLDGVLVNYLENDFKDE